MTRMPPRRAMPPLAFAFVLAVGAAPSPEARAQRAWMSDVSVRAMDVSSVRDGVSRITRMVVVADGDRAHAVRLEVMLPIGVSVLHVADGCRPSPGPVATLSARVTCELGDLPADAPRSVFVTTGGRPSAPPWRIAAFAFSDTPDPLPSNNYAERVAP